VFTQWILALTLSAHAVDLSVSTQVRGGVGVYTASAVPPGTEVTFLYGFEAPRQCPAAGPCIRPSVRIGTVVADAAGVATLTRDIPENGLLGPCAFQAASAVVRTAMEARPDDSLAAAYPGR
jgi:hypothetical protein